MITRDINFFSGYESVANEKKNQNRYTYSIAIIFIVLVFSTLTYNLITLRVLNKEINKMDKALNDESILNKVKEAEEVNEKASILEKYDLGVSEISSAIDSRHVITKDILDKITSTMPSDITFNNISITSDSITISAVSKTRTAIAEVQHNLKELDIIGDVFIGSISGDGTTDQYSFDLDCKLVGDQNEDR